MSYFKAKMHQIRIRLGLSLRRRWGVYIAPQTPELDLRGLLLNGKRRWEGKEGMDNYGENEGRRMEIPTH